MHDQWAETSDDPRPLVSGPKREGGMPLGGRVFSHGHEKCDRRKCTRENHSTALHCTALYYVLRRLTVIEAAGCTADAAPRHAHDRHIVIARSTIPHTRTHNHSITNHQHCPRLRLRTSWSTASWSRLQSNPPWALQQSLERWPPRPLLLPSRAARLLPPPRASARHPTSCAACSAARSLSSSTPASHTKVPTPLTLFPRCSLPAPPTNTLSPSCPPAAQECWRVWTAT